MYFKKVRQRIYSENSIQFPDHSIWSRGQRCPRDQLKAVKVGFVVCKGVFVAYIFYCTNQCSFIWHIWHDPYFCSKWNHSTVNWRQTLTDGGSVWSIYVLYNYLWLRKTLFCDCSCYRFFCKNFAAISIKIARRYKYL